MEHQLSIVRKIYRHIRVMATIEEGVTPNAGPTYRDLQAVLGYYRAAFPALHSCAANLYHDYLGLDK